jgi:hypothetical protein
MLVVLSPANVRIVLDRLGPQSGIPWLFVKQQIFDFVDFCRMHGLYLAKPEDQATEDAIQKVVFTGGNNYEVAAAEKVLWVLGRDAAKQELDKVGSGLGNQYTKNQTAIWNFVDTLYRNGVFVVTGRNGMETLLVEKTKEFNLRLNVKGISDAP